MNNKVNCGARTTALFIIALLVSVATAFIAPSICHPAEVQALKINVLAHVAHGVYWSYGVDVYNHNDVESLVSARYLDATGNALRNEDFRIPAYGHIQLAQPTGEIMSRVRTIILTGNGGMMVTAYQMSLGPDGAITGVSTIPVYEDKTLKN